MSKQIVGYTLQGEIGYYINIVVNNTIKIKYPIDFIQAHQVSRIETDNYTLRLTWEDNTISEFKVDRGLYPHIHKILPDNRSIRQ